MRTTKTTYITFLCLLIAGAVLLSGAHAKELLPAVWLDAHKAPDATQQIVKLASEVHDHADKSMKLQVGDNPIADHRSLRLLSHKKSAVFKNNVADRLFAWWQLNTLFLS